MPWIFLLSFAIFAPIFFRYPAHTPELSGGFAITHVYDLEKGTSLPGPEEQWNGVIKPFPSFEGERTLKQSTGSTLRLSAADLAFIPFLGRGYFRYQKVGKEVSFYSEGGELLWRKPFQSYPVSDTLGKVVLLLTGDNNRVEIVDWNGNQQGTGQVSGNFMTDVCFPSRSAGAGVIFSAGAVHLIDGEGRATTTAYEGKRPLFLKSCAMFPDGSGLAVHLLEDGKDRITVFVLKKGRLVEDWSAKLPEVLPHWLAIAASAHGVVVTAPDYSMFLRSGGSVLWKRESPVQGIYRPVYADSDFFAYGDAGRLYVLDSRGRTIGALPLSEPRVRVLPGKRTGLFAIEAGRYISFYHVH